MAGMVKPGSVAELLRMQALQARAAAGGPLETAERFADLPLAAAMEGPPAARGIFARGADPWRYALEHEKPMRFARMAQAGYDLVRVDAKGAFGKVALLDTSGFSLVALPEGAPLAGLAMPGGLLKLAVEPAFAAPGADGWASTAPELGAPHMRAWSDRLDLYTEGTVRLLLIFKIPPGPRLYAPSREWF